MKKITGLDGVPDFECHEYAPKRSQYCLLIPVINEGGRILAELQRARAAGVDELADIILCDGGSTDGSTDVYKRQHWEERPFPDSGKNRNYG